MNRNWLRYLILLFLFQTGFGQTGLDSIPEKEELPISVPSTPRYSKPKLFDLSKPTIGVGSGLFSYYGDILGNKVQFPFTSRLGYELFINYRLTKSLLFDFYVLFGKLGANERLGQRNENFLSEIRLGGLRFNYDFSNFLSDKAILKPFVFTGIESFEFLSKTDLYDKSGKLYNYWSDGSIRSGPENGSSAQTAQIIKRDYIYESDIRELNKDKFGKYLERSFAIPAGVGFSMEIGNRARIKFASTMHFTFTDLIDGITDKSLGNRAGRKGNDKFLLNSVSIHYDMAVDKRMQELRDPFIPEDELYVLDNADADGDGVIDDNDSCHGTPKGVKVDLKGCPLDDDKDRVYNYKDLELTTAANAPVDSAGVTITDPMFQKWYDAYADTNDIKFKLIDLDTGVTREKLVLAGFRPRKKSYTVQINNYKNGIPTGELTKLLGIPDVKSFTNPDSSVSYTLGNFDDPAKAKEMEERLKKEGFKDAKAGTSESGDGKFDKALTAAELVDLVKKQDKNTTKVKNNKLLIDTNKVVYRVQLGAYKKQLSTSFFKNTGNVVAVTTEDGLYKYLSGSYPTLVDAASYRADMVLEGYTDAFIAAYKGGRRISLTAAGAIPSQDSIPIKEELDENVNTGSALDKSKITFKIQLGIFKNETLGDATIQSKGLDNIEKSTTVGGLVRFTAGSFGNYQAAIAYKNEMAAKGFPDAFVIAFFNNETIPLTEALELLKQ
jgi:hypothetical protein